jgi:hypothetical protein
MKNIKSILLLMLAIFVVSCVEVEPDYKDFPTKDVDFVFEVEGNEYTTDFYYVSPIKFKNTSFKKGALSWDFNGDGKVDSKEENPTYKYDAAGKYYVASILYLPCSFQISFRNGSGVVEYLRDGLCYKVKLFV